MNEEPKTEEAVEPPVIEGQATELQAAGGVTGTTSALIRPTARPTREVLVPLDAESVIEGMQAYQSLLPRLLDDSDYQGTGSDRFVKKSGWRKIARAFNLSVEIVSISILRDERGKPERAECIARALAPNGQIQDADGYCSIEEFTGKRANDSKIENTLRATATTRAKNRAIADLVGMGEVSAEEMENVGGQAAGPPYGPAVDEEGRDKASTALAFLLDSDAEAVWNSIVKDAGYMPTVAAGTIRRIARTLAERDAKRAEETKAEGTEFPPPDAAAEAEAKLAEAKAEEETPEVEAKGEGEGEGDPFDYKPEEEK